MAMNNSNNFHPRPSSHQTGFSTPLIPRTQRPRFAYSGPPSYPRPRSSASKPNPDGGLADVMRSPYNPPDRYNDSMANNCDSLDFPSNNSYNNSYWSSSDTSAYVSCNETFYNSPQTPNVADRSQSFSYVNSPLQSIYPPKFPQEEPIQFEGHFQSPNSQNQGSAGFQKASYKSSQRGRGRGTSWQNNKKKTRAPAGMSEYKCTVCDITFTSGIPYDMHLRGAKHAKKLKRREALKIIKAKEISNQEVVVTGSVFRCEVCNIIANSSLQLQTHLDGVKHKAKVGALIGLDEEQTGLKKKGKETENIEYQSYATIRSLPTEFEFDQPSKKSKLSCDLCDVVVNSDSQLQQHLVSKKHLSKLEGKALPKKKFSPAKFQEAGNGNYVEPSKTVVGVKTLSSSFVAAETMQ